MALMHISFFSSSMGMETSMDAVIPQTPAFGSDGKLATYPVLYLLHGMSDDGTVWGRRTLIERYAEDRGIAVIMPSANLAWYTDMDCGYGDYFTFTAYELPEICRGFFPRISAKREETWIAGLSMGGYGAVKAGLARSDFFGKAAGLSGHYSIEDISDTPYWNAIFGTPDRREPHTIAYAVKKLKEEGRPAPGLYMACGTEDSLLEDNRKIKDLLTENGLAPVYKEAPGAHSWTFWDREIVPVLDWMISGINK